MRKLTHEEVESRLLEKGILLLERYVNRRHKHKLQKISCGHTWVTTTDSAFRCGLCPQCMPSRKLTLEEVNARLKDRNIEILPPYTNIMAKSDILFHDCGHTVHVAPSGILAGNGCGMCYPARKTDTAGFIAKAVAKWGDRFTYDDVDYVSSHTPVTITCDRGHTFQRKPNGHLTQGGCFQCKNEDQTLTQEEWIAKSEKSHGKGRYDYSKVVYVNSEGMVEITCDKGHTFIQKAWSHQSGQGCPSCITPVSSSELELLSFVQSLVPAEGSYSQVPKVREVDIFIPSLNIGIEYNGLYWHGDSGCTTVEPINRHILKTKRCAKAGVRLIHIFEDEWVHKREKVENYLKSELVDTQGSAMAETYPISNREAWLFNALHSFNDATDADQSLGHYVGDELVGVSLFKLISISEVELVSHVVKAGYNTVNALSDACADIRTRLQADVVAYCDLSKQTGSSYEDIGFIEVKRCPPDYMYVTQMRRNCKSVFTREYIKSTLRAYDEKLSIQENCRNNRIFRIFDCGKIKYVLPYEQ